MPPSQGDPEPVWHQFAELPKVQAVVTEFQGHARTCSCCGHVTREAIPAEIRAMKVLWRHRGLDGLILRRELEAQLFEAGLRA